MARDWLYRGAVMHDRISPVRNAFRYPALFICFPLHRKAELASRLFSLGRFNLFAFHEADHGDGIDCLAWVRRLLADMDIAAADGEVWLQTMPRMLGVVFNPVSFWYCHDRDGCLRAVLCEVNNTFGERHCYLLTAPNGGAIGTDTPLQARKVFHVSPFFPVRGEYRFRIEVAADRRRVHIDYWEDGELMLRTAVSGRVQELNDRHLLRLVFRLGWYTLLVVLRIHWQALRLWLKKIPFHKKPLPPTEEISR